MPSPEPDKPQPIKIEYGRRKRGRLLKDHLAVSIRGMRAVAWVIFVLSVLAIFFCGYAFLFWAWVTATPLTPAQLSRAQYNAYVWFGLAALSLVAAVVTLVWAIRLGRRKVLVGFDVVPSNGGPAV
jgi:hypothetical protein